MDYLQRGSVEGCLGTIQVYLQAAKSLLSDVLLLRSCFDGVSTNMKGDLYILNGEGKFSVPGNPLVS